MLNSGAERSLPQEIKCTSVVNDTMAKPPGFIYQDSKIENSSAYHHPRWKPHQVSWSWRYNWVWNTYTPHTLTDSHAHTHTYRLTCTHTHSLTPHTHTHQTQLHTHTCTHSRMHQTTCTHWLILPTVVIRWQSNAGIQQPSLLSQAYLWYCGHIHYIT